MKTYISFKEIKKKQKLRFRPKLVFTISVDGYTFSGKKIMFTFEDIGLKAQLKVDAVDHNGVPRAMEDLLLSSSDESIVTVDQSGIVTAIGYGSAKISATADALIGEGIVTIVGQLVFEVKVPLAERIDLSAELIP